MAAAHRPPSTSPSLDLDLHQAAFPLLVQRERIAPHLLPAMTEDEKKIQDIYKKIEREKNIINAAQAMRSQTTNEAVRSRLDTQLRDGRRNLQFFEEKLRDIQMRQVNQDMGNVSLGAGAGADDGGPPPPPPKDPSAAWGGDQGGYGTAQYSQGGQHGDLMPPRHPYAPPGPGAGMPKSRPNFTKLGVYIYIFSHQPQMANRHRRTPRHPRSAQIVIRYSL